MTCQLVRRRFCSSVSVDMPDAPDLANDSASQMKRRAYVLPPTSVLSRVRYREHLGLVRRKVHSRACGACASSLSAIRCTALYFNSLYVPHLAQHWGDWISHFLATVPPNHNEGTIAVTPTCLECICSSHRQPVPLRSHLSVQCSTQL